MGEASYSSVLVLQVCSIEKKKWSHFQLWLFSFKKINIWNNLFQGSLLQFCVVFGELMKCVACSPFCNILATFICPIAKQEIGHGKAVLLAE